MRYGKRSFFQSDNSPRCDKNNLKHVSVSIPKGKITVVTGVFGVGLSRYGGGWEGAKGGNAALI